MEEKYSRKEIKKINSETMDRQKGNRQPWIDFWGKTLCFPGPHVTRRMVVTRLASNTYRPSFPRLFLHTWIIYVYHNHILCKAKD